MEENKFSIFYEEVFPFWRDLPISDKEFVCDSSFELSYKKGTHIHDGSECSGVFMVQSGCLRIYIMSEEGKDITLYRLHPGDMCMLAASASFMDLVIYLEALSKSPLSYRSSASSYKDL